MHADAVPVVQVFPIRGFVEQWFLFDRHELVSGQCARPHETRGIGAAGLDRVARGVAAGVERQDGVAERIAEGLVLVPEDRQRDGLVQTMSVIGSEIPWPLLSAVSELPELPSLPVAAALRGASGDLEGVARTLGRSPLSASP